MDYHFKGDLSNNDAARAWLHEVVNTMALQHNCGCSMWHDSDGVGVVTIHRAPDKLGTTIDTVMELVYDLKNIPVIDPPVSFKRPQQ